ncbi:hypothetical protein AB3Y40_16945 [Yoonia sp. R2331]|uniref:hypothetical protein n=1 Tax=Yoonia sp. R2331 TaxID=3237238 RepID=UPI0034E3F0AD
MDDLFVYFDGVSAMGHVNGAIQVELAASVLDAAEDGSVEVRNVTTAHLRCSPAAAADLLQSIQKALDMLKEPEGPPSASKAIN